MDRPREDPGHDPLHGPGGVRLGPEGRHPGREPLGGMPAGTNRPRPGGGRCRGRIVRHGGCSGHRQNGQGAAPLGQSRRRARPSGGRPGGRGGGGADAGRGVPGGLTAVATADAPALTPPRGSCGAQDTRSCNRGARHRCFRHGGRKRSRGAGPIRTPTLAGQGGAAGSGSVARREGRDRTFRCGGRAGTVSSRG